ncbi:MAG: NUDIX hydrolase [Bacteroidales bacterium]|nr:NUDIX hydrolase [Bacteroidales bacterium]
MFTYPYPRPMFTTDCMVFNFIGDDILLLLIERGHEPFKGFWATPGGFMEMDELPEHCAVRELKEETGIEIDKVYFSSLGASVERDPRGRLLSAFYFTLLNNHNCNAIAGDDAKALAWFSIKELPKCATDHEQQIITAVQHIYENTIFNSSNFNSLFSNFSQSDIEKIAKICKEIL